MKDLRLVLSDLSLGIKKDALDKMYLYATQEKFYPLLIDMESPPEERFRKGFLELLDPSEFGDSNFKFGPSQGLKKSSPGGSKSRISEISEFRVSGGHLEPFLSPPTSKH